MRRKPLTRLAPIGARHPLPQGERATEQAADLIQYRTNLLYSPGMANEPPQPPHPLRTVRVDTLVRLRWLAIAGQTATVLVVHFALDFTVPLAACATVIAVSAWLNVTVRLRYGVTRRLEPEQAAWLLAFDIAQLTMLLYLTGGVDNPFSFMLLAPVVISATALPPRITMLLGGFAVVCATALVFMHFPLPWASDDELRLPALYTMGNWVSILIAIGFIGVYAWQISEETRRLADALTATELALAREQHLSQLDGLAAAAAHELATPKSRCGATISSISVDSGMRSNGAPVEDSWVILARMSRQRCACSRRVLMSPANWLLSCRLFSSSREIRKIVDSGVPSSWAAAAARPSSWVRCCSRVSTSSVAARASESWRDSSMICHA